MHEVCLRTKSAKFSTARHAIYTFNSAHIASVSLDPVSKQILAKLGILESRLILASGEYLAFCPKNMENCAAQQQGQGLQRGHY